MRTPMPDGRAWTVRAVSRAAKAHGHTLSPSYVRQLRAGVRTNPSIDVVQTLALVFDVPVSTFYPEPDTDEIVRALDVLHAAGAEAILTRGAGHLSPRMFRIIADAIGQAPPEQKPEAVSEAERDSDRGA